MKGSLFNGQGYLTLRDSVEIQALRNEVERYKYLPQLMNLYGKLNGFFDSKFISSWEEQTGLPWKEWGKL
jgi:C4-dicarboxylate-specific signal transduction histidine kinase